MLSNDNMWCFKYILIIFILLLLLPPLLLLFFFCFIFVFSQNLRWFWPKLDTNLICYPTYENVLMGFRPKITFKYHLRKSKKMTVSSHKGFRSYLQKITRGGRISPPLWQLGLKIPFLICREKIFMSAFYPHWHLCLPKCIAGWLYRKRLH